jgi:Na+/proline symporter
MLATFLAGLLWKKPTALDVVCGLLAGIAGNFCLWIACGQSVHWMWWNVFGLAVAILVTALVSRFTPDPDPGKVQAYTLSKTGIFEENKRWWRTYLVLGVYFFVILAAIMACTLYGCYLRG